MKPSQSIPALSLGSSSHVGGTVFWFKILFAVWLLAAFPLAFADNCQLVLIATTYTPLLKQGFPETFNIRIEQVQDNVELDWDSDPMLQEMVANLRSWQIPIRKYTVDGTVKLNDTVIFSANNVEAYGYIARVSEIRGWLNEMEIAEGSLEETAGIQQFFSPDLSLGGLTSKTYRIHNNENALDGFIYLVGGRGIMHFDPRGLGTLLRRPQELFFGKTPPLPLYFKWQT